MSKKGRGKKAEPVPDEAGPIGLVEVEEGERKLRAFVVDSTRTFDGLPPAEPVVRQASFNPAEACAKADERFRTASEDHAQALNAKQLATDHAKETQEALIRCWDDLSYRRRELDLMREAGQTQLALGGAA